MRNREGGWISTLTKMIPGKEGKCKVARVEKWDDALTANQEGYVCQVCAYAGSENQFIPAPNGSSGPGSHRYESVASAWKGTGALTFEG
jgi:hypothetical protein